MERPAAEHHRTGADLLDLVLDTAQQRGVEIDVLGEEGEFVGEHPEDLVVGADEAVGGRISGALHLLQHLLHPTADLFADAGAGRLLSPHGPAPQTASTRLRQLAAASCNRPTHPCHSGQAWTHQQVVAQV